RPHRAGRDVDDGQQHQRMDDRGGAGAGPGPQRDGGAGDRTGGGHTAEQGGADGGDPLPHQLAVRVEGAGVGHRGGHARRQQRLDRRQRSDGGRSRQQHAQQRRIHGGQRRRGQRGGDRADRGQRPGQQRGEHGDHGDPDQRTRHG